MSAQKPRQTTPDFHHVNSIVNVERPPGLTFGVERHDVSFQQSEDMPSYSDVWLDDFHNSLPKDFGANPVYTFKGGESEALKGVQRYLFETDAVATYFNTRNGMLEDLESTKLAPFLSLGCISPRFIENEIRKYEKERVKNKSTYWVIFELT